MWLEESQYIGTLGKLSHSNMDTSNKYLLLNKGYNSTFSLQKTIKLPLILTMRSSLLTIN